MITVKYTCPNSPLIKKEKQFSSEIEANEWIAQFKKSFGDKWIVSKEYTGKEVATKLNSLFGLK